MLSIGGAEQSHVNLADPADIFYEYLRRIGHVVDLAAPWGEPITALHLGAGALTLARYIQATRPGSVQYAVELERELLDFVLQQLPLPEGTELHTVIGDARDALAELPAELRFDVVILDIFSGPEAPEHIACTEFYQEAAAQLTPRGVLIVNVGDEPGLTLVRSQVAAHAPGHGRRLGLRRGRHVQRPVPREHHPDRDAGAVAGGLDGGAHRPRSASGEGARRRRPGRRSDRLVPCFQVRCLRHVVQAGFHAGFGEPEPRFAVLPFSANRSMPSGQAGSGVRDERSTTTTAPSARCGSSLASTAASAGSSRG